MSPSRQIVDVCHFCGVSCQCDLVDDAVGEDGVAKDEGAKGKAATDSVAKDEFEKDVVAKDELVENGNAKMRPRRKLEVEEG